MRKFNKVVNIVLICLAVSLGVAALVLYIVDKSTLTSIIDYVVEIFNKPLPVIGITLGTVLFFVWKLVITTNYGKKKIAIYDEKLKEIEEQERLLNEEKDYLLTSLENENKVLREQLVEICSLSTNKKIKNYGKELEKYGKETINSETKAE